MNTLTGEGRITFLNGTVILTKSNGIFDRVLVAPTSYYYGCVKIPETSGGWVIKCWNNTKYHYLAFKPNETDYERATGILYIEYSPKNLKGIYYFRNGSLGEYNEVN